MSKRLLSALVALCMALTLMPAWAFADEPAEAPKDPAETAGEVLEDQEGEKEEGTEVPDENDSDEEAPEETPEPEVNEVTVEGEEISLTFPDTLEDNDQLAADFLNQNFPGVFGDVEDGLGVMADFGNDARSPLDANEKVLYNLLRVDIEAVANGEETNTQFVYQPSAALNDVFSGFLPTGSSTQADQNSTAYKASAARIQKVMDCLRADLPSALYWCDRGNVRYGSGISYSTSGQNGAIIPNTQRFTRFTFSYGVSKNYGSGYTVTKNLMDQALAALENADQIVEQYKSASDVDKLKGYLTEICKLVSYDNDALSWSNANPGGDLNQYTYGEQPWQLIHVFDKNPSTNVVCEGYSKAFQYLCDRTEWQDSSIESHIVTGEMAGGTGAGGHMWNIVTIGSKNYLVDVTNCDTGSIGSPDKLFLCGVTQNGNTFRVTPAGQGTITYTYDSRTTTLYGNTGILTLSSTKYEPPVELRGAVSISPSTVTPQTTTLTASVSLTSGTAQSTAYQWLRDGAAISGATGSSYTIADADRGHKLSVKATVTLTNNSGTGTLTSAEVSVPKLNPNAPDAPAATATYNSITVTSPNPAYEYACSTTSEAPATGWKSGNTVTFTGLTEGTTYYVFARVKATASGEASDASAPTEVKTPVKPGPPSLGQFTHTLPATVPYTGSAQPAEVTSEIHDGHFKVLYNGKEAEPVQVGRYTVTVQVEAHDSFTAATLTLGTLTISKADVRITVSGKDSLSIGETMTLAPELYFEELVNGQSVQINGAAFSFTSSNRSVASVSPASGASTTVTAGRVGATDITIRYAGNANFNAASLMFSITVSQLPKLGLAFTSPTTSVAVGDTVQNAATVTAPEGTTIDPLPVPTYSSSDESVATVAADGTVTALKVGSATITATVEGVEGTALGNTASYTLNVSGKSIEAPTVTVTGTFTYSGEAHEPVPTVTSSEPGFSEADYEVSYENNIDAGTAKVIVKPKGENFSWSNPAEAEFTIVKAAAPTVSADDATIQEHWSYTDARDFSIAGLFGEGYELLTCTLGEVEDANGVLDSASLSSTVFSYKLAGFPAKVEYTATAPVTVTFKNHEDLTFSLVVKLVDLPSAGNCETPVLKLVRQADGTYIAEIASQDGAEYNFGDGWQDGNRKSGYQGGDTVTFSVRKKAAHGVSVSGPEAAGTPVIVAPGITPPGGTFSGSQTVTLHAKAGTKIVYTTNGSDPTYSMSADETPVFNGNGTLCEPGTSFTVSSTTTVKAIVVVDPDGTPSFSGIQSAAFTKRSSSSGSGGGESITVSGSGGSGTAAAKPTTPKPSTPGVSSSGDTTTAAPSATVKDGVASSVVSGTIGKDLVDEAVKNDSNVVVVAPSIPSDADQTDVTIGSGILSDLADRTDADLRVETPAADVTISSKGLSGLANKGGSLVVSTTSKGDSIDVSITAGGSKVDRVSGGLVVEIPTDCTYGTVAMVTKADGTTELVRKSVADASYGTVRVPLDGSASITLVDRSKSFSDVPAGNTFANAVAFVSSREIMNGTGADVFNPSAPLTRAQLAKILHNLEGNPAASADGSFSDVAADAWCAEAVQWAAGKGIVTGYADGSFKPNAFITREQLAVMLYRYAGSPSVDSTDLRFNDASLVGSYAQAALAWATQNGVVNGKGGNMLDPKGQATRAQTAQMLLNYMNSIG